MELKQALDDKIMDYRLRDRLLGEGKVTKDQVDNYLKQLPDETQNIKPSKGSTKTEQTSLS